MATRITIEALIQILETLKRHGNKVEIEFDDTQFLDYWYKKVGPRSRKIDKRWSPGRVFLHGGDTVDGPPR